MKVAIITDTYWPPSTNGVAVSVANLRDGLLELGHEVDIFAPAMPDFDLSQDGPGIYRITAFQPAGWITKSTYPLAKPSFRGEAAKRLRRGGYDVVHTHHPFWLGAFGQWYARWMGIAHVATIHTQYEIYAKLVPLAPQPILNPLIRWWVRGFCNRATLITTPGEGNRRRLLGLGVRKAEGVQVVSNPTNLQRFWDADATEIRRMYHIADDDFLLGYVGRISAEKNLVALLEAYLIILKSRSNAKLMIVGGTRQDCQWLRNQVRRLGVPEDKLIITGHIPYDQIHRYYAAMDLFITASFSEVQPMSFAEAFGTGLPIVAFNVSGCNDMIEDGTNGRLVSLECGASGLAHAALPLMTDVRMLQQMSDRARRWSQRYETSCAVPEMVRAYDWARTLYLPRRRTVT